MIRRDIASGGERPAGPYWTTRRKVVVGVLIVVGVFGVVNLVGYTLFERHSDYQFDLATLRLELVWSTEFIRWEVWRQVEVHDTPASLALARTGLTTGMSGKAGGGTTYWRTPTWWGGYSYFIMGHTPAYHPLLYDDGVVLLLKRKGADGLPTLRKVLQRFCAQGPEEPRATAELLYRTLREDYPEDTWNDLVYGTGKRGQEPFPVHPASQPGSETRSTQSVGGPAKPGKGS